MARVCLLAGLLSILMTSAHGASTARIVDEGVEGRLAELAAAVTKLQAQVGALKAAQSSSTSSNSGQFIFLCILFYSCTYYSGTPLYGARIYGRIRIYGKLPPIQNIHFIKNQVLVYGRPGCKADQLWDGFHILLPG